MLKRYFILVLFFSTCILNAYSQNLVPNPSFEDTLHCPTNQAQIYNAPPWFNPTANTPDYFNSCYSGTGSFKPDVPNNFWGYQYARTGIAYAGVGSQYHGFNVREYIEIRLLDTLIQEKKYCIEFYISLGDSSTAAVDDMGAYLSKDSIYETGFYIINLPYAPQIENSVSNIIYDKVNWTKISGEYIAGGGEKFLTIGSFYPDNMANIDTIINNNSLLAYYYIDDVSVSLCDTTMQTNDTTIFVPNAFSPNGDGENDVFKVYGKLNSLRGSIYNRWGEEVFAFIKPQDSWDGKFNNEECSTGVYFYYLMAKGGSGKEVIRKGNLTLLR